MVMIFLVGGGVLAYQFYFRPIRTAENRLHSLADEMGKSEKQLADLEAAKPRLAQMKKLSLPADVAFARQAYVSELEKMLRLSEFATDPVVSSKEPTAQTSVPLAKRQPFTRLQFDIQTHGELANLVDFLVRFYNTPLLHRIKTLSIVRPLTSTQPQRANDLDITISIEALIVDGAEKRTTLLPKDGFEKPKQLARTSSQYATIAGHNIFFGPAPQVFQPKKTTDAIGEYIVLDGIWHDESGSGASIYDAYNNRLYEIHSKGKDSFEVKRYMYLKNKKELVNTSKNLVLLDDLGAPMETYRVVRIDAGDLILDYQGAYYRLHVGWRTDDAKEISAAEAKALGLSPLSGKGDEKEEEKKPVPEGKKLDAKLQEPARLDEEE
jgi:hypothetical protein